MDETLDFKQEWVNDCKIGSNLQEESINVYMIHNKYMMFLSSYKRTLRIKKIQLQNLKLEYTEYYSGAYNLDSTKLDELKKEPLPRIIPKDKILNLVEAEPRIQKLTITIGDIEDNIYYLEQIIKALNTRTYQIKTILDIQKFEVGG